MVNKPQIFKRAILSTNTTTFIIAVYREKEDFNFRTKIGILKVV